MKKDEPSKKRRDFLKFGLISGAAATAGGIGLNKVFSEEKLNKSAKKVKVLSTDGKLVEVDSSALNSCCSPAATTLEHSHGTAVSNEESRIGIRGRKFVMVIDLAKCEGCGECTKACQKMHYIPTEREWIKVYKMQDGENTIPYWLPKPCFHCDNPPCTKVCPVNATFKRQDGIVLIDNTRCIGCRFCMAACPYSTRFFNWFPPKQTKEMAEAKYSPEQGYPRRIGTVEKCDFCPHMIREGKMPACVNGCTKGVIYFGDENEDAVTNSFGETVRLSVLLKEKAGYRYLEDLGTKPRVYYLPPKNRRFPEPNEKDIQRKIKPSKI